MLREVKKIEYMLFPGCFSKHVPYAAAKEIGVFVEISYSKTDSYYPAGKEKKNVFSFLSDVYRQNSLQADSSIISTCQISPRSLLRNAAYPPTNM